MSRKSSHGGSSVSSSTKHNMEGEILFELDRWKDQRRESKIKKQQRKEQNEKNSQKKKNERERERREKEANELRQKLLDASTARDASKLRQTVKQVEEQDHVTELRSVYDSAIELIESIEKLENLEKARKKFDHSVVVEIRNYNKMPEVVHEVFVAAMNLLEYDKKYLKRMKESWSECQKACVVSGDNALHKLIQSFDPNTLTSRTVCSVLGQLDKYERQYVCQISGATGLLYDWAVGVCEEKSLVDDKTAQKRRKQRDEDDDDDDDYNDNDDDERVPRCKHC